MASINPYIHFDVYAEQVFSFYKSVFGGDFAVMRFKDVPKNPDFLICAEHADRMMPITLLINKNDILKARVIHPLLSLKIH